MNNKLNSGETRGTILCPPMKELSTANILVIDDSKHIRDFVSAVLQREGAAVVGSATAREALEICRLRPFDLIMVDLRMPDMDGFETLKLLRSQQVAAPMIAFSAGDEQQQHVDEAGFACFMSKPVERATLVDKIRELLNLPTEV